jgi:dTDP-4-amino-4,6-dideoxygalactose transaminase
VNVPFLDLQAQYRPLKAEMHAAIDAVLDSSTYVLGPAVEAFENEFARYCGASQCIGVNSGTAALALLLQAHGIGEGDEVITVANSFFASAEAVSEVGATPVLVDCEEDTALIDPVAIGGAITDKTRAIIPVHLYGQCADMDRINEIAKTRKLLVFEDACQAHGATYKGRRAGSLGDGAAFSFYPGKNLGAYGEGGAVTVNDPGIAERLRMLREHGSRRKYHHDIVGWNERMDGIQGAVLNVKLPYLDKWNARRREHAAAYHEAFNGHVQTISERPYGESVYHLFVIRHAERDALQAYLGEKNIQSLIHYPVPIHLQPAYAKRWKRGSFPATELLADDILSLPIYPEMSDEQRNAVIQAVLDFNARTRGGNV